jgi:Autoinducer binding domain
LNRQADTAPLQFRSVGDATQFLIRTAEEEGVAHLSYWYLQYRDGTPDQVIWVATYDPAYMSHYMSHFTPLADPVLGTVMENKYVDWAEWFGVDHLAQAIYEQAERHGISKFGLSMPLAAPGEDKIIFSVNVQSDDARWPEQRSSLVQRFRPFAQKFDESMRPLLAAASAGHSVFKIAD